MRLSAYFLEDLLARKRVDKDVVLALFEICGVRDQGT
jgi:hypothetical protein